MTATWKPQVRAARTEGGPREDVLCGGDRGEVRAPDAQNRTVRTSAETDLRDRYAELQASGLACDRW